MKYCFKIIHGNTNMCDAPYLEKELNFYGEQGYCIKKVINENKSDFVNIILQKEEASNENGKIKIN